MTVKKREMNRVKINVLLFEPLISLRFGWAQGTGEKGSRDVSRRDDPVADSVISFS